MSLDHRIPVAYVAPWLDIGGSDKGTIDWFRALDRGRFAPSLITTQPRANRRIAEVDQYADEVWPLPDLMPGCDFPHFLLDFIYSRNVEVVHIMNSRLAFDLLPDLASLSPRPALVVQLHVEESDRSGYVRYVTTRYGNLVDAFSVTSAHLAAAVEGYDIPRDKIHVIYTGVDADWEFLPSRIRPMTVERDRFHILYAGRLVEQKDPQLMVEVVAATAELQPDVLVHIVGEGALEAEVRDAVSRRGIEHVCRFEGASLDLGPWYAACDALLMTSEFEGVPYAAYEAMAMGIPVVAPALAGNVELLSDAGGMLIEPRDDVGAYARALNRMADAVVRDRFGADGRKRARERFSLRRMADEHAALYLNLLRDGPAPTPPPAAHGGSPRSRIDLARRPTGEQPLVSVIVPCFNHGRFLTDCLDAIERQSYANVEVVVVDDASTDSETRTVIAGLEQNGRAVVLRQANNRGPSAARNAALAAISGRYVLPVDADNLLLPDAIERLVGQLQSTGERVGFIYPNPQYFGNRDDYFEAPSYNLHALLRGNYCDTCSLFDRGVFDAGIRFAEDIGLGHEDWDLVLALAERGIRGEPARGNTLLYRKHGFTRSDLVEYAPVLFAKDVAERHRELFADPSVKPRWCPGLTIITLEPVDVRTRGGVRLAERLASQTIQDVELLAAFDGVWPLNEPIRSVRRIPPALASAPGPMLSAGLEAARARRVLVVQRGLSEMLADRAVLDKLLRILRPMPDLDAIALADANQGLTLGLITDPTRVVDPHAVLLNFARPSAFPHAVQLEQGVEVAQLAQAVNAGGGRVQWRHLPSRPGREQGRGGHHWLTPRPEPPAVAAERAIYDLRRSEHPRLSGSDRPAVRRWLGSPTWVPPETLPLARHRHSATGTRIVTTSRTPPAGYDLEYDLGVVPRFSPPGTARLELTRDGKYRLASRGSPRPVPSSGDSVIGSVEQAPLPMFDALSVALHRPTGQHVLISGEDDPLASEVEIVSHLGWIESYPINPRRPPTAEFSSYGLVGLLRAVDHAHRRHRYAADTLPEGELVEELGGLWRVREHASVGLWVRNDGKVETERYAPPLATPDVATIARWSLAPLSWRGFGRRAGRARSAARRLAEAPYLALAGGRRSEYQEQRGRAAGYLTTEDGPGRLPLFSSVHPVNGDQLLTHSPLEATDMGFVATTALGFMRAVAPMSGSLETRRVAVPWGSRFGLEARR